MDAELRFFRDIEGREVDFVQLTDSRPTRFVECKLSDTNPTPALVYLKRKFPAVEAFQVVARPNVDRVVQPGIRVCSAAAFLGELRV